MKLAIFLATLLLWGTTLAATSTGEGYDEDCSLAKAMAISNALNSFSKKEFEVSERHVCKEIQSDITCQYQKDLSSQVAGTYKSILSEKKRKDGDICIVDVTIEIEKARMLKASVKGRKEYYSGEIFDLALITEEPLYAYVFNDHADGLQILMPPDNKPLLVRGKYEFSDNKKIKYQVTVYHPYEQSEDTIIVLFTKYKVTFKPRLTKKELYDTIKSIPVFSRRVVYHTVTIKRRP
jgi:hypothetical protein